MNIFKTIREKYPNEMILFLIFLALFVIMSILSPDVFFSGATISNMMYQMPEFGLMALAMMAVILTGGINLSIITASTLSGILAALVMRTEWGQNNTALATVIGVVIIIGASMLTGVVNGYFIGVLGIVAMVLTLATQMIFEGLGLVITSGKSIPIVQEEFLGIGSASIGPIPVPMLVYVGAIILAYFMLERSRWGRNIYMIGDNEVATRFSGVNTKKVILLTYVFSGLMYGLSSMLITSRLCSAKTDYGSSYLMQAVTAVVMGGTDIMGGSGTVAGTVLAVLILQTLSNGFVVFHLDQNLVNIFSGCILIFVLAIRYLTGRIIDAKKIKARRAASEKAAAAK
ncbi:MAG: ABC transporter permease [Eubacterium sp.]|nr:ABC transporter permease [Eubacterium sp.]